MGEAFARAQAQDPEIAKLAKESPMGFADVFSAAMDGVKQNDPYVLASPLWNFEDLLPLAPAQADRIAQARMQFEHTVKALYRKMDRSLRDPGAELDDKQLGQDLRVAVCTFFEQSRVDRMIGRYLDRFAYDAG